MNAILRNKRIYKEFFLNKKLQITFLYILIFAIPFFFKSPQYVIGTIVNFLLIMSFSKFNIRRVFPILFIPSIATFLSGKIFGGATNFLLYLIPFISFSNFIFVYLFKKIKLRYLNVLISSITKASFLFVSAFVLHKTIGLPALFLTTMGISQFYTAMSGGTLAFFTLNWSKKDTN
ncbi:MAG TPA: hypothetical protein PLG47_05055 [Candidatus Dojkabacteria bacterium]|nr:hypothetical protein [Candidatus Dojkabacteria bacterium]